MTNVVKIMMKLYKLEHLILLFDHKDIHLIVEGHTQTRIRKYLDYIFAIKIPHISDLFIKSDTIEINPTMFGTNF